jgi:hypothetical protein
MTTRDPIMEWRERWVTRPAPPSKPARTGPRSPWVYYFAAFGGTVSAVIFLLIAGFAALLALGTVLNNLDPHPNSLTYSNDTEQEVLIYECYDRCTETGWGFWIEPGEETSMRLEWYWGEEIEWIIVANEDYSYNCIHLLAWEDQTIRISSATRCPEDIHSPELNLA